MITEPVYKNQMEVAMNIITNRETEEAFEALLSEYYPRYKKLKKILTDQGLDKEPCLASFPGTRVPASNFFNFIKEVAQITYPQQPKDTILDYIGMRFGQDYLEKVKEYEPIQKKVKYYEFCQSNFSNRGSWFYQEAQKNMDKLKVVFAADEMTENTTD